MLFINTVILLEYCTYNGYLIRQVMPGRPYDPSTPQIFPVGLRVVVPGDQAGDIQVASEAEEQS